MKMTERTNTVKSNNRITASLFIYGNWEITTKGSIPLKRKVKDF